MSRARRKVPAPPAAEGADGQFSAAADWVGKAARDLAADGFAVFSVTSTAERQLTLHLSGGAASSMDFLPDFQANGCASEAARHALAAGTPFWWGESEAAGRLGALSCASRAGWFGLAVPGLGLPCATERGQCGVVLFWGERIAPEPGGIHALHAQCCALFERLMAAVQRLSGQDAPHLTPREVECLRLAARGMTSKDAATHLDVSSHTVDQHLAKAAVSLNAVNRTHAVAKALRLGLLD